MDLYSIYHTVKGFTKGVVHATGCLHDTLHNILSQLMEAAFKTCNLNRHWDFNPILALAMEITLMSMAW